MKKRIGILLAMAILMGIPYAVKAAEPSGTEKAVKSYGTIVYEDKNGSVRIYAEDIALLQEKLASIPDEIFDPVLYSHTHVWEYIDVTDQGHTKHCDICGSKYDVTNAHSEALAKECTITYDGHDYPGYEKSCECGWMWKTENGHSTVYTTKDETYHTQSCALDGTSYCIGMEKVDLPHMIMLYPTDQTHHQKRCSECGYQGDIEECVFDLNETTDNEENNASISEVVGDAVIEVKKYCACGNYIVESTVDLLNADMPVQEAEEKPQAETEEAEEKLEASDMDPQIPEIIETISGNDCVGSERQEVSDNVVMIEQEGADH